MKRSPCFKNIYCVITLFLIMYTSSSQANEYLFVFLGGNARTDLWLVEKSTGDIVVTEIADSKTDADSLGRHGNIAFDKFSKVEKNIGWLAQKLIKQALIKVAALKEQQKINITSLSFMYAIAGLDAVDGQVDGFDPVLGRKAIRQFEDIIDAQFANDDYFLKEIYSTSCRVSPDYKHV